MIYNCHSIINVIFINNSLNDDWIYQINGTVNKRISTICSYHIFLRKIIFGFVCFWNLNWWNHAVYHWNGAGVLHSSQFVIFFVVKTSQYAVSQCILWSQSPVQMKIVILAGRCEDGWCIMSAIPIEICKWHVTFEFSMDLMKYAFKSTHLNLFWHCNQGIKYKRCIIHPLHTTESA